MFFKKKRLERSPEPQIQIDLTRTYPSMSNFKGTKRLHVTVYGDIEHGMENAASLLGEADHFDSPGTDITLTSFRYHSGTGIKIAVDGHHVGVCWGSNENERSKEYKAAYKGTIEGLFVRIERELVLEDPSVGFKPRPKVSLYVK